MPLILLIVLFLIDLVDHRKGEGGNPNEALAIPVLLLFAVPCTAIAVGLSIIGGGA